MFGLAAGLANADWASGSPPAPGFKPNRLSSESPPPGPDAARPGIRAAGAAPPMSRPRLSRGPAPARPGADGLLATGSGANGSQSSGMPPSEAPGADGLAARDAAGAFDGLGSKPNAASGSGRPAAGR